MYGKVIGPSISVDSFQEVAKGGMYFLTEGVLQEPLPPHVDRIYTSIHNASLLHSTCKIDPDKIVRLPINEKLLIQDKVKKLDFYVTLINAQQKPGAVMFLFEGEDIGNVLYAGKCCYNDNFFSRPLYNFLKLKVLDSLYIHEACPDCHNHSLSVSSAIEDVVNLIRQKPANSRVVILEPCLREDILGDLINMYRKPICVSESVMKHLEANGRGADFTLDLKSAEVYVTNSLHDLKRKSKRGPVLKVILIPCSIKKSGTENDIKEKLVRLTNKGYHVTVYRNHCSGPELESLVRDLGPRHTILVRPASWGLDPWAHLGDFSRILNTLDALQQHLVVDKPSEVECVTIGDEVDISDEVDCTISGEVELMDTSGPLIDVESKSASNDSLILIDSDHGSLYSKETTPNIRTVLC